jgi:MFS superfamily sulfate permease-like transporter
MRRRVPTSILVLTIVAAFVVAVLFRIEETAQKAVRDAESDAAQARQVALQFQAKAKELEPLLTEATFRDERSRLLSSAKEAVQLADKAAAGFRRAAENLQRAIDLTRHEELRAKWALLRDSQIKRADAAQAACDGYKLVANESIATFAELRAKMEPFAQRAEAAKAESERLNATAESRETP